jgi:ketosteroid isomerase-like protein
MSVRKSIVNKYIDGFRRNDHAQILSCLSDDIIWQLHGYKTLRGKPAFDAEIENDAFQGSPTITLEQMIEEGPVVVATGSGSVAKKNGKRMTFVFSEVFTFAGESITRLDTYHVWTG